MYVTGQLYCLAIQPAYMVTRGPWFDSSDPGMWILQTIQGILLQTKNVNSTISDVMNDTNILSEMMIN